MFNSRLEEDDGDTGVSLCGIAGLLSPASEKKSLMLTTSKVGAVGNGSVDLVQLGERLSG